MTAPLRAWHGSTDQPVTDTHAVIAIVVQWASLSEHPACTLPVIIHHKAANLSIIALSGNQPLLNKWHAARETLVPSSVQTGHAVLKMGLAHQFVPTI